jgi:mitochondrial-processing peptidase subunit beta
MASRRLALNFQRALRNRQALQAVKPLAARGLATPVSHGAKTESTTLTNGFTVRDHDLKQTCIF